ncbi:hypothetical protein ACFRR7_33980 [Streptomyces sp. NPDC056909]
MNQPPDRPMATSRTVSGTTPPADQIRPLALSPCSLSTFLM